MSHRGSFLLRFLATILLVVLLFGAGYMVFQAGQAQGYALGAAASGKALQSPPSAPGYPGYYGFPGYYGPGFWGPHFFFPFGPLFGLFFLFLFIFLIGGLFRRAMWGRHGWGPYGQWHGPMGGPYPWGQPPQSKDQPAGTPEPPAQDPRNSKP